MLYRCMEPHCDGTWGTPEAGQQGYSHGWCPKHVRGKLIPIFQRDQTREGNPDCCGRSHGYCQQHWCTFHPICPVENPGQENIIELEQRLAQRNQFVHYCSAGGGA